MGVGRLLRERNRGEDIGWLDEIVTQYYMEDNRSWRAPKGFYPSGIPECDRAKYLFITGCEPRKEDITIELLKRWKAGSNHEQIWQDIYEKKGLLVEYQKSLERIDPYVRSRLDFIIRKPSNNVLYLVELKSWHPDAIKFMKGPKSEHILQWQLTADLANIGQGFLHYSALDLQSEKKYPMKLDHEFCDNIYEKLREIEKCVVDKMIPPRECASGCARFKKCQWRYHCDAAE